MENKTELLRSFVSQIMKLENIKLSEEALAFKNCFVDMNEMNSKIQTACKEACKLFTRIDSTLILCIHC